ncbi:MAG: AMP-binding protein, partial [Oscillospiraceae bacterium]
MNIFDEICRRNAKNLQKLALIIRLGNKTERTYTFGEMFDAISAFGELLLRDGITAGDRVAIVAESSPEWSISYLAVASLNATSVLLDASLPQQDLIEQLEKSDVRCILASTKVIQKLGKIKQPIFDIYTSPKILLEQPKIELRVANFPTNPEAASIIFSSGTTKKASGILHSHDSLIKSSLMCMRSNKLNSHDLFMAVLPNSHIYGLICQLYGPLLNSSTVCFIEEMTSEALVGAFMNFRPTIFPAVPKIFELLKTQIQMKINSEATTKKLFEKLFPVCLKLRQKTKINLGKAFFKKVHNNFGGQLRILCSAGAPISPETAAFFYGIGFDMLVTYGATETSIPTIGNYGSHITTETCGIPYPDIAIKISESGEILIKTPYKMLGYFGDETATKDAFDKDGWFKSGDLGCVDKKGFVRILGRCKDNIVLANGKKVAPDDIEEAYQ